MTDSITVKEAKAKLDAPDAKVATAYKMARKEKATGRLNLDDIKRQLRKIMHHPADTKPGKSGNIIVLDTLKGALTGGAKVVGAAGKMQEVSKRAAKSIKRRGGGIAKRGFGITK
jgi:hypothetical protein